MIHGIRMPPKLAAGSKTPMLATLVIFPAQATAVGFMPAMEKAKAKSRRNSSYLVVCHHQSNVKYGTANAHFDHGCVWIFKREYKGNQKSSDQCGSPHNSHGVGA